MCGRGESRHWLSARVHPFVKELFGGLDMSLTTAISELVKSIVKNSDCGRNGCFFGDSPKNRTDGECECFERPSKMNSRLITELVRLLVREDSL